MNRFFKEEHEQKTPSPGLTTKLGGSSGLAQSKIIILVSEAPSASGSAPDDQLPPLPESHTPIHRFLTEVSSTDSSRTDLIDTMIDFEILESMFHVGCPSSSRPAKLPSPPSVKNFSDSPITTYGRSFTPQEILEKSFEERDKSIKSTMGNQAFDSVNVIQLLIGDKLDASGKQDFLMLLSASSSFRNVFNSVFQKITTIPSYYSALGGDSFFNESFISELQLCFDGITLKDPNPISLDSAASPKTASSAPSGSAKVMDKQIHPISPGGVASPKTTSPAPRCQKKRMGNPSKIHPADDVASSKIDQKAVKSQFCVIA